MFDVDAKEGKPITKAIAITITYLFLIICALIIFLPFLWMITVSFTSKSGYATSETPLLFTDNIIEGFKNYGEIFSEFNLDRYFVNTIIYSALSSVFMILVVIFAAYALSRYEFKGKKVLMVILIILSLIPTELLVIGDYTIANHFGLQSTFIGLIFPSIFNALYVYVLYIAFKRTSNNVYRASKLDGLSDFSYLTKVLIPIHKNTIIAIVVLKFIECWNSYLWPSLVIDNPNYNLMTLMVSSMKDSNVAIPLLMAVGIIITIPTALIFIFSLKKINQGLSKVLSNEE